MKTHGTSTATEAVVSPIGSFSDSLTISGVPVSTGTGSSVVSVPAGRVPFGDAGSLLTSDPGLTFDATYGELTIGPPLSTALLGRQTQDSTIIINAEAGAGTRSRQVFAEQGRSRFEWLYTPAPGDPGLHFFDVDKIVNRITVSSGTNSTLHRQLHLDADGTVHLSNQTLTTSGTIYPQTRGIGVDGNVTATGTIASRNGRFSSSLTVSGVPVVTSIPAVAIPSGRIPFGSTANVLDTDAGLVWLNTGSQQRALQATHISLPTSGTSTDPIIHGGDTTGRTSGLYYISAFGVIPVFVWSISGLDTVRLTGDFFLRRTFEVGVPLVSNCNLNVQGRIFCVGNSVTLLHNNTTAQRDALGLSDAPSNGAIHYNTTTNGFQGYRAGSWRDFTLASGTGANIPSFTPASSADAAGGVGDLTFGGTNLYLKTTTSGWVRFPSQTF